MCMNASKTDVEFAAILRNEEEELKGLTLSDGKDGLVLFNGAEASGVPLFLPHTRRGSTRAVWLCLTWAGCVNQSGTQVMSLSAITCSL